MHWCGNKLRKIAVYDFGIEYEVRLICSTCVFTLWTHCNISTVHLYECTRIFVFGLLLFSISLFIAIFFISHLDLVIFHSKNRYGYIWNQSIIKTNEMKNKNKQFVWNSLITFVSKFYVIRTWWKEFSVQSPAVKSFQFCSLCFYFNKKWLILVLVHICEKKLRLCVLYALCHTFIVEHELIIVFCK